MTCVCSVGLDMIAVPGDTTAETISAIIADEAAIGMVNSKTTAVRIIPAPGKKVGDTVEFGGLLGSRARSCRCTPIGCETFIAPRRPDSRAHAEPEELKNVPQERDKLRRGAENAPRRSAIFGSFSSRKTGRFGVYFCHWDIPCYTDEEAV